MRNYGLDKYKRLAWRIYDEHGYDFFSLVLLDKYIMLEVGIHYNTRQETKKNLKKLGWIKKNQAGNKVRITEEVLF